jgi:hypothetical protein
MVKSWMMEKECPIQRDGILCPGNLLTERIYRGLPILPDTDPPSFSRDLFFGFLQTGAFMVHGCTWRIRMPRILNDRDKAILSILAPEVGNLCCEGSGHEFQSILPPVSNHFARDEQDFADRIARLSADDLEYLVARILDGSESMGCMPPEDVDSLVALIGKRISLDTAKKVRNAYGGEACDLDLML